MIEGDEGEVVVPDGTPRGETLLVKAYLEGLQTKSLSNEEVDQQPKLQTVNSLEMILPKLEPITPSFRPVTPQSFRSHSSVELTSC